MRVLLANKYYGRRGGAESVVLQTQRLVEQAGHEVVPFAMRYDGSDPTEWSDYFVPTREYFAGSIVRRVGDSLAAIYSFDARRRLRALLRAARPDVAHLHNVYHQLSLSIVDELRSARIPIVMTLHDYKAACPNYQLLTHDGLCQRCVGGAYWNAVRHRCLKGSMAGSSVAAAEAYLNRFRRQYRKIDLFLAPSEFLRDVMVRAGLPADRIEVLRNAVPVEPPRARTVPTRPKFVYFGRLSKEKGVDWILDASRSISPGVEVVVLGSGPLEAHLRARVEREGLTVQLNGFVMRDALVDELTTTTAALLPSGCYENCPMSVLEAGALGVPTIASDIGGIRELISNGIDGVLVPVGDSAALADAVNELAERPERVASLGKAAHARVSEHHSEDAYAGGLLAHYDRLLHASRPRIRAS
ncbi:MAG: glycosyltransferase family 4 protein [Actinomycetota bacterium]|nr:glycosyltransferase family 4 protein [Actinomycetota bacterium]